MWRDTEIRWCNCVLRVLLTLTAMVLLSAMEVHAQTPVQHEMRQGHKLALAVPVERELKSGQVDVFAVEAKAGDFLHVIAEKKGIDLVVTIADPSGKTLIESDSPNGSYGPEPAATLCPTAGEYSVRVSASSEQTSSGRYQIQLVALREPIGNDKVEIEAEKDLFAGTKLSSGSRAEREQALPLLSEAADLWRSLENSYEQGLALGTIGAVYEALGQEQKALEYYNQALPIQQAVGDRRGEAETLNNIGLVYDHLGQKQKALEFYNRALPIQEGVGDRSGEATTLTNIGAVYHALGQEQKALEYYNQALLILQEVGDRSGEAVTLNNIGLVYDALGQKQKALEYYNRALPILQAVGDRSGEAVTMSNIGMVYDDLGQKQKALEYYNQALLILQEVGDRSGEGTTLNNIGLVYDALGQKQKALEYYNQALPIQQAVGNRKGEATTLNNIGMVYGGLGQEQKALEYYNQALPILQEVGNRKGEGTTLNNIGMVYGGLGQEQKALEYYNQALPIQQAVGDRSGEGTTLNNIGLAYRALGQTQKALEYYNQALPILQEAGDRRVEATTLNNVGLIYDDLGQKQKALEYYNQALPIRQEVGDRKGEAVTLNNIGMVYGGLGQKQKALEYLNQALPILQEAGDRRGEAVTLNNVGLVYDHLGQKQKALEYYNQALPIRQEVGDRKGEAVTLNNIGMVYGGLGQKQKALEYYNQALPIQQAVGNRKGEATTLNNIGLAYYALGQRQKALEYYNQVLPIWQDVGDRSGEATTLNNIGLAYYYLGQQQKALPNLLAALSSAKAVGDPELQGGVEVCLMGYFRDQKQPEVAIFFGKQAVNSYQQIRKNISGLDKELQAGFAKSKSDAYRMLAELLVIQDRLGEAEQVLDLLKLEEFKETVRGPVNDSRTKMQAVALSPAQQEAAQQLPKPEALATGLVAMSAEYDELAAKASRTEAEERRFQELDGRIKAGNKGVLQFFEETLYSELKVKTKDANKPVNEEEVSAKLLQNAIRELGPGVVGVRTFMGDERTYVIVETANALKEYPVKIPSDELKPKILAVREELRSPESDPQAHLQELYELLVAPIEDDLKGAHIILWSLDGVLRYLPMAALYDGKQYLVERFANVEVTPLSYLHLGSTPGKTPMNGLAMGLAKSYGGLPELTEVTAELDAIVHDPLVKESHGPLPGTLLLDNAFTRPALEQRLRQTYALVHIASHFEMVTGEGTEPYLLLSDGRLTLSDLEVSTMNFSKTRLLTLSACSTGALGENPNGREVESLGMAAQGKDAAAVLVTLWSVSDRSTSRLMTDFYTRWTNKSGPAKIEALQQAQKAMLRGLTSAQSGAPVPSVYAHPYYWAPFVLIGNYQ